MTTRTNPAPRRFRLPDPPKRANDEMTSYDHLFKLGMPRYLALYFGNPETTMVEADRWIVPGPEFNQTRARRPDLLIAFGVNPGDYRDSNGYIVSEQGKPPDFVMEIASESTADADTGVKSDYYAALGIPEYWRFDETGRYHGTRLAGDRLVDGAYVPIPIVQLPDGRLQGHSEVLDLDLRWTNGQLGWYDPRTGQHIPTMEATNQALEAEREAREAERQPREAASQALEAERQARATDRQALEAAEGRAAAAEAHARELEAELRRLRNG